MGKLVLLAIGIGLGYAYGFNDAREHEDNVVTRVVNEVRTSLGRPGANVDSIMTRLEERK